MSSELQGVDLQLLLPELILTVGLAMIILIPNSRLTQILVNSVIIPLILPSAYVYVYYQIKSSCR